MAGAKGTRKGGKGSASGGRAGARPSRSRSSSRGSLGQDAQATGKRATGKSATKGATKGATKKSTAKTAAGTKAAGTSGGARAAGKRLRAGLRKKFSEGLTRAESEGWADWIETYQDALAVASGCWFEQDSGELACDFMAAALVFVKGKWGGQPFLLMPWQRKIVMQVFGWKRADGTRRFRRVFIFIPKKNGKTAFSAAMALTLLVFDQEPGAEIYFCATRVKDQADRPWKMAAEMVNRSDELKTILKVHEHVYKIVYPDLFGATLTILAAEHKGAEGQDILATFKDELHVWTDREFFDALTFGGRARAQPLDWTTTTAGNDITSIGYEEYQYAKQVASGAIDAWHYLPVIYEAHKDDDWTSPQTWAKANPSYGEILSEEDFREDLAEAQVKPAGKLKFLRYRLNIWNHQRDPWLDMDKWLACGDERARIPGLK